MRLKRFLGTKAKSNMALGDDLAVLNAKSEKSESADHHSGADFADIMRHSLANHSEDTDSNWLISYADMMTLLFGFFVMLMSFSKIDVDTYEKARKETTKYFGGEFKQPFQNMQNELREEATQKQMAEQMHFDMDSKGITVTFRGALFFDTGSIDLKSEAVVMLKTLIPVIQRQGPDMTVIVEGHTDDNPISDRRFPSNWELSAFRASTVLRVFEQSGFNRNNLRAIGFGDTVPAFPNRDKAGRAIAENQAQNRRVVLRIIRTAKK